MQCIQLLRQVGPLALLFLILGADASGATPPPEPGMEEALTTPLDSLRASPLGRVLEESRLRGEAEARERVEAGAIAPGALEEFEREGLRPGHATVVRSHRGLPKRVSGLLVHIAGPAVRSSDGAERVAAFVAAHEELFAWQVAADELEVLRTERITHEEDMIRVRQVHGGYEVIDTEMIFHLTVDGTCSYFSGFYIPKLPEPPDDPSLNEDDALDRFETEASGLVVGGAAELVYVDPFLHGGGSGLPTLAWRVRVTTAEPDDVIEGFVDAETGEVFGTHDPARRALRREIWDAGNAVPSTSVPYGTLLYRTSPLYCDEWAGCNPICYCAMPDDASDTFYYMSVVYNYWKTMSDAYVAATGNPADAWLSYDGLDSPLKAVTNVGLGTNFVNQNGVTGWWQGGGHSDCVGGCYYSLPDAAWILLPNGNASLDWVAHEYAHGFLAETAQLGFQNQPGAIEEHLADVLAAVLDTSNWTVFEGSGWGQGVPGRLRSLQNPANTWPSAWYANPAPTPQPDTFNNLGTGSKDEGLVHLNCGIGNKAAYLLGRQADDPGETGGECMGFGGIQVCGQGRDALGWTAYLAERRWLVGAVSFHDWRDTLVLAAWDYETNVAPNPSYPITTAAFQAVEAVGVWRADGSVSDLVTTDDRVSAVNHSYSNFSWLYMFFRDRTTQWVGYQRMSQNGTWGTPTLLASRTATDGPAAVERWPYYAYVFYPKPGLALGRLDLYYGVFYVEPDVPNVATNSAVAPIVLESVANRPVLVFYRDPGAPTQDTRIRYARLDGTRFLLPLDASTRRAPAVFEHLDRVWVVFSKGTGNGLYVVSAPTAAVYAGTANWVGPFDLYLQTTDLPYNPPGRYSTLGAPSAGLWTPNWAYAGDRRAFVTATLNNVFAPASPALHVFSFEPRGDGSIGGYTRFVPVGDEPSVATGPVIRFAYDARAYLFSGAASSGRVVVHSKGGE